MAKLLIAVATNADVARYHVIIVERHGKTSLFSTAKFRPYTGTNPNLKGWVCVRTTLKSATDAFKAEISTDGGTLRRAFVKFEVDDRELKEPNVLKATAPEYWDEEMIQR